MFSFSRTAITASVSSRQLALTAGVSLLTLAQHPGFAATTRHHADRPAARSTPAIRQIAHSC
ncbi:hypothetical protein LOC54_04300 [Acetobacter sp. AN02]|uniref:hypothetical protein n=1 Tax=Acetobacter sp. AN02 TaxID=2894186 RepID=UPI00243433DE|nr:hypothetical protein [Acetobacter sp. AN02]MDG6094338.1 hypothetical protein [Acetobacter sp. AN02]